MSGQVWPSPLHPPARRAVALDSSLRSGTLGEEGRSSYRGPGKQQAGPPGRSSALPAWLHHGGPRSLGPPAGPVQHCRDRPTSRTFLEPDSRKDGLQRKFICEIVTARLDPGDQESGHHHQDGHPEPPSCKECPKSPQGAITAPDSQQPWWPFLPLQELGRMQASVCLGCQFG